jgi:3'-phosphoadenosine 5'-phosphosulfate sulfotransferase (PAPS reductase)/FAD synthetase
MNDPFKIEGPAVISFSGGRTSGYMLWRILQSHGGTLPDDVKVSFANTGKEMPETLDFVKECSERWNVPIVWVEYEDSDETAKRMKVVDYKTAARNGEPYDAIIKRKNYLPNPVARFCTVELKIFPIERYARSLEFDDYFMVIGLRADEQRRAAKVIGNPSGNRAGYDRIIPLYHAGITAADVGRFWDEQPFTLNLPSIGGITKHGNCDLCFLKGAGQVLSLIREQPSRATWWIKAENSIVDNGQISGNAARFRSDRPSYAAMYEMATKHGELFDYDETLQDCACTD